jgi:hypothetical protein
MVLKQAYLNLKKENGEQLAKIKELENSASLLNIKVAEKDSQI